MAITYPLRLIEMVWWLSHPSLEGTEPAASRGAWRPRARVEPRAPICYR